jgi:tetratricopeptide (TPR) repeat protein
VTSADASPLSNELARDLFAKLGRLQSADANSVRLIDPNSETKPDFILQTSGSPDQSELTATIALVARSKGLLWSKDLRRPAEEIGGLKQQIGFTAAQVLACADEGLESKSPLDEQMLKLYLRGCADYAELSGTSVREVQAVIPLFEQVTNRVPRFQGAWAKLLLAESEVATNSAPGEKAPVYAALRRHLAAARQLDPDMPSVLQAEILLLPPTDFVERMKGIERAIELHPDSAALLSLRSNLLMSTGRMSAAVRDAKHAASIDILSPSVQSAYIFALAQAGQLELAFSELARAQEIWPGAASLNETRFAVNLRYGDPKAALTELKTGVFRSDIPASQETLLEARLNPNPSNIDRAIGEAFATRPQSIRQIIQVLAEFGREQQLIQLLLHTDAGAQEPFTDVLFRPNTRKLRADARFMLIAKRFGLIDYWIKTGNWPDFCSDPDLPYDCKKEAAKLQ